MCHSSKFVFVICDHLDTETQQNSQKMLLAKMFPHGLILRFWFPGAWTSQPMPTPKITLPAADDNFCPGQSQQQFCHHSQRGIIPLQTPLDPNLIRRRRRCLWIQYYPAEDPAPPPPRVETTCLPEPCTSYSSRCTKTMRVCPTTHIIQGTGRIKWTVSPQRIIIIVQGKFLR